MQNRSSRTAEPVALFRALESARRTGRIFDDPFAVRFLPVPYRLAARAARVPAVGRRLERFIGLVLIDDLSARDAAARYFTPLGRDEPTAAFYRTARARTR